MRANQKDLFEEYFIVRANTPECRRVSQLESTLVLMNQHLIYYVAKRYYTIRQHQAEIKSVGMAMLLKAVRNYDPQLGSFASFAIQQLRSAEGLQSIVRFYASGPIKIPHNAFVTYATEKRNRLEGIELSQESQAVETAITQISRFGEDVNDNSIPLEESIEQSTFASALDLLEYSQKKKAINAVFNSLGDRERQVVDMVFGMKDDSESMDLRSVGKVLSISHEGVRKIRDKALERMRKRLINQI